MECRSSTTIFIPGLTHKGISCRTIALKKSPKKLVFLKGDFQFYHQMQKLISIKKIFTADIFKISFLNAIAVLIKMLTGFVSMKAVANILGPAGPMGIAMLGQLNNFTTILLAASNGGINNGITRYIAENCRIRKRISAISGDRILDHGSIIRYMRAGVDYWRRFFRTGIS